MPLHEIDPEETPPPAEPPSVDDLTPEEAVAALRNVTAEHAEALKRVWESRDAANQLISMSKEVSAIGKDVAALSEMTRTFIMPAVKNVQGRLEVIERANEGTRGKQDRFWEHEWPTALKTLESIGSHMGRIEKDVDRVERNLDAYIKRADEKDAHVNAEIAALQTKSDRTDIRLRALEDFSLTVKVKVAAYSAALGLLGAIVWWVVQKKLSL